MIKTSFPRRVARASVGLGSSLMLAANLSAQVKLEVSWGSQIIMQKMILEDGSPLDSGSLIMEVGSFGSFVPTGNNMNEWLDHWKVFDAITDPDTDPNGSDFLAIHPTTPTLARYAGSAHLLGGQTSDSEDAALQNPTATFAGGEQGYVFFRTNDAVAPTSQWLLFTSAIDTDGAGIADSDWEFISLSGGQPQFSLAWWLDQADTAIVGAINGGDGSGGDTGAGTFSDTSNDFAIRLHAVPEPGAGLLLTLSSALLVLRRKRGVG